MQARQEFFSGPLPPPEQLEHYGRIVPNGAERVLAMAERQSQHRQDLERTSLHENVRAAKTGQWMAYSLGVGGRTSGVWLLAGCR